MLARLVMSRHLRALRRFPCSGLANPLDHLSGKGAGIDDRRAQAADVPGIKGPYPTAERENRPEGLALDDLDLEELDAMPFELVLHMAQGPGSDGGARARQKHGIGDRALKGLLLLLDQPDGLGGLLGVELGALRRHNHQIAAADGVADHKVGCAFEWGASGLVETFGCG